MLASQIIETGYPVLSLLDKAEFALQLMEDYETIHLPVNEEDKFYGIISKHDLAEADGSVTLGTLTQYFINASVLPEDHLLSLLKTASRFDISLVPVVNKNKELQGVVTRSSLLLQLALFFNVEEPGGMLVIEMDKRNFSFGEMSRLIETNDASITQLNTYTETATGNFIVTIRVNRSEISDIIATLQRYDYQIRYYFGEEDYENELKENYDLLMTYLNI